MSSLKSSVLPPNTMGSVRSSRRPASYLISNRQNVCPGRVAHAYRGVLQLDHSLLLVIEDFESFDRRDLFEHLLQEPFLRSMWEIFDTDGPIPRLSYPAEASFRSCEQSAEDRSQEII